MDAEFGHVEVAAALVKAGADLHATTSSLDFLNTPLHMAAGKGHEEVAAAQVKAAQTPQ